MGYRIVHTILLAGALVTGLAGCREPTSNETPYARYVHYRSGWSPDSQYIAFTGTVGTAYGIHVITVAGDSIQRIHTGEGVGLDWAPDSRWMVFSSVGSLYKIKVDGDSLTRLTVSSDDFRPSWSPDGNRIAFVRNGIWLLDLRTSMERPLYHRGNYPSWHPNNRDVVVMDQSPGQTGDILYRFTAINTENDSLSDISAFTSRSEATFPALSPDGTIIALGLKSASAHAQLFLFDLSTQNLTQLTSDGGDHPAWSPAGSQLVYTRANELDGGLWVINVDGTGMRRLTYP